jgi:hypothetical protein
MEIIEGINRVDESSRCFAHSNVYLVIYRKEMLVIDNQTSNGQGPIFNYGLFALIVLKLKVVLK